MMQNQKPEDIDFINEIFLHPTTQEVNKMVIRRLIFELRTSYHDSKDLQQEAYLESIRIVRTFFKEHSTSLIGDEWERYYYAALYRNLKHRYLLKYMGYKYDRNAQKGHKYNRLKTIHKKKEEAIVSKGELMEEAWEAVETIRLVNPLHSEVLIMKYEDYSEMEIAAKLDISLDSVKNYTRRSRAAARKWRDDQAEVS
ncbi:sigma factor-like helix-turn-helix DNA-binding protein [Paenibacillus sp. YN15]|uniref:sigma factor-like helix-turn-helix DNA-binding protein n=1 Tax=Paenibacillus sp. YN15 TaxID=1742774 RepID=UPI0011BE8817|nr:sigma factor-like helix-turn-helix DNA-binding protein [Paenibacillus sp. YN15]